MWKQTVCALLILFSSNAYSCGCGAPRSPSDVRNAVHIFEGVVTAVEENPGEGYKGQNVTFKVRRRISGPKVQSVKIAYGGTTSCDLQELEFEPGQTWIISDFNVYLAKDNEGIEDSRKLIPSGFYRANLCSLRQRVLNPPS